MTIEDPVEYKLQGMAQIGVNPKIHLNFSMGLRHILRQDPDVIMIGEIRDKETAEIAIQASLTGHLVLSTLHTNDAPSALTRLIDMGIESYLLTSSIVGVMAQRLVRVLCSACKTPYSPSSQELKHLRLNADTLQTTHFFKAVGCPCCFGSGYKGRHGIYELMTVTHEIKQQLLRSADAHQLQSLVLELGMRSLRQEGADLVVKGITSSEEVFRVTRDVEGV
jgi:general secretion pathway protein E